MMLLISYRQDSYPQMFLIHLLNFHEDIEIEIVEK